jgi:hypothetical protein
MRGRKLRWVLAGLAALLVLGASVWWEVRIVPGVTQTNFNRVQLGMTVKEVKALLGESTAQEQIDSRPSKLAGHRAPEASLLLFFPGKPKGGISVSFNSEGKVVLKDASLLRVSHPGPSETPYEWAVHQWRKWVVQYEIRDE